MRGCGGVPKSMHDPCASARRAAQRVVGACRCVREWKMEREKGVVGGDGDGETLVDLGAVIKPQT